MGHDYEARRGREVVRGTSLSGFAPGKRTLTESLPVQRKAAGPATAAGGGNGAAADPVAHGFSGPASGVPHAAQMSRSFGTDFAGVQAFHGPTAQEACEALGAEAFTVGNRIAFKSDAPSPQLVGHELAHTVQQGAVAQGAVMKKDAIAPSGGGLEEEADRAGEATARGESVSIAGRASSGVQCFQISAAQQAAHPRATTFVRTRMPNVSNDSRLRRNLRRFGTNTGATARNIPSDVAWGAGPTVNFTALAGANGEFSPGVGSTELRINETIATDYQAEANRGHWPRHELFLESTILHEYTHYLDDQDGTDRAGEEGQDFEEANYGRDIDSIDDAASVLNPRYGGGTWTVTVEGKSARFPQRFVIEGAASGDGTYEGTVGVSATVTGPATGRWRLRVEADRGEGFRLSRMHNVRRSSTNFLVRSDDGTDRDMNDLEIRVVRTAAPARRPAVP